MTWPPGSVAVWMRPAASRAKSIEAPFEAWMPAASMVTELPLRSTSDTRPLAASRCSTCFAWVVSTKRVGL